MNRKIYQIISKIFSIIFFIFLENSYYNEKIVVFNVKKILKVLYYKPTFLLSSLSKLSLGEVLLKAEGEIYERKDSSSVQSLHSHMHLLWFHIRKWFNLKGNQS